MNQKIKIVYKLESSVYLYSNDKEFKPLIPSDDVPRIGLVKIYIEENDSELDFHILLPKFIAGENISEGEIHALYEDLDNLSRIEIYKKIDYYSRDEYKIMIFALDYAMFVYAKLTGKRTDYKLTIEPISESHSIRACGQAIAIINAIWNLLNFEPDAQYKPKIDDKDFDLKIHESFRPRWVTRDVSIDFGTASQWIGFDDDLYETYSRYQWITQGEKADSNSDI